MLGGKSKMVSALRAKAAVNSRLNPRARRNAPSGVIRSAPLTCAATRPGIVAKACITIVSATQEKTGLTPVDEGQGDDE